MPKPINPKLAIHLDLLRPQSNPEKLPVRVVRWLLSTGRYIFIFVEALVLVAFISRFKLDADLASKKEAIEQQIPYIESLEPFEILIRTIQVKLSTIDGLKSASPDYPLILKKIADQTPSGVKLISLNLGKEVGKVTLLMNAQAQNNSDLIQFIAGLKSDGFFSDVNLTSVGLEQGVIRFAVNASASITEANKSL